ncbi:hypothetical protein [Peribacillus simplex]|uniref:hypothetical protein n=1 Tax=Peribacillus simplex TaxID=1478 RepID=UPI003D2BB097
MKTRKHEPIKDAFKKGCENNGKVSPDKLDKKKPKKLKNVLRIYYVKDERTQQFAYSFMQGGC